MTLNKLINQTNNQLVTAKMENLIQYMYEEELQSDIAKVFHQMREQVISNLKEYYSDVMFEAHTDMILSPIHEHHKKYYDTIMKYKLREYRKGKTQAKRLVKRARKYAENYAKMYGATKADDIPINSMIQKDTLFATSDYSAEHMQNKTFIASENTLSRVDKDINNIITDGYRDGWGINTVANSIEKRFDQLETWEAKRIARTEIHGSHMQGIMQTYQDMGVEYTQWAAAHDNRTRDTHSEIDGEIIPFGGTYSNGLQYPGDTAGPISEWINCRCGNLPWFCPPGMMVPPGMTNFRESDLVTTLDKWSNEQLLTQIQEEASAIPKQSSSFDLDIINPDLIESKFSIPNEDLSEFGISEKGLETIQRYTKRRSGSDIEYGVVFNEKNGKFLSKEFRGNRNDIAMAKPNGKYSTIHYHTDEGFRPASSGDFYEFLNSKKERVGINISRKESWFIKNERKFAPEEINKITMDIAKLEQKQLKKLNREYKAELEKINKKDSVKRQSAKKELDRYVANEFLDKHNTELGDAILEYTSNIKGLKVKRVIHTELNPKSIKTISKKELKVDKRSYEELMGIKRHSTSINPSDDASSRVKIRKEVMKSEKDKYALTTMEQNILRNLESKETLEFREKSALVFLREKEYYNEMRTQIITRKAMVDDNFDWDYFYELHEKFKDWTPLRSLNEIKKVNLNINYKSKDLFKNPKSLDLTPEEKELYNELISNRKVYYGGLSKKEAVPYKKLKIELADKEKIAEYHRRAFDDAYGIILNERESKDYIDLWIKYQEKWDLPNIDLNAMVSVPNKRIYDTFQIENNFPISDRFKLTDDEDELLKKLMKHKFLRGGNVSPKNEKYIQLYKDQRDFNDLYSLRLTKKGLSYNEDKLYRKLAERLTENGYDVLNTVNIPELSIYKELHVLHKSELALKEGAKRYKTIKGLTYDGSVPQGLEIDDLFTYDVRNLSNFEEEIYDGWLNNHYRNYRAYFTTCNRNKECYNKILPTLRYNISAEELEYNWRIIQNINKNQLKKNLRLFRRQRNHHLADDKSSGIPEVGDCVTFHGFNSTAITKEGADYYAKSATHNDPDWEDEFKWLIEIEAPTGTEGAYVAPIAPDKFKPEMEFLLQNETKTILKEFDKDNHHAVVQVVKECPKRK